MTAPVRGDSPAASLREGLPASAREQHHRTLTQHPAFGWSWITDTAPGLQQSKTRSNPGASDEGSEGDPSWRASRVLVQGFALESEHQQHRSVPGVRTVAHAPSDGESKRSNPLPGHPQQPTRMARRGRRDTLGGKDRDTARVYTTSTEAMPLLPPSHRRAHTWYAYHSHERESRSTSRTEASAAACRSRKRESGQSRQGVSQFSVDAS